MKKILIALIITLGFSINTVAQEAKKVETTTQEVQPISPFETKAKKDVADLKSATNIKPEFEAGLFQLFKAKHKMIFNAADSPERIATIKQGVEQKLKGILGEAAFSSVKSNAVLFENLMN
jgi:hypothetical protein